MPEKIIPKISNKAVFFDRDGTLCEDAHYLNTWDNLKVFDDISTLKLLIDNGYLLIGITNQSGIARGIVDEQFVRDVNDSFIKKHGFKKFYYCPHLPDEGCQCRKPEPGMLKAAAREFDIDLERSFVVGDKDSDMLLGRNVGAKCVFVRTGQQENSKHADIKAENLKDAVRAILSIK